MLVKIPTPRGALEIELFERAAPLACRCLRQQLAASAWAAAEFAAAEDGGALLLVGATRPTPRLARENRHQHAGRRGLVAYAETSAQLVLFTRSAAAPGSVFGRLTPRALAVLDAVAAELAPTSGKRALLTGDDGSASAKKPRTAAAVAAVPAAVVAGATAGAVSAQLRAVLDFERRLRAARLPAAQRPAFHAAHKHHEHKTAQVQPEQYY